MLCFFRISGVKKKETEPSCVVRRPSSGFSVRFFLDGLFSFCNRLPVMQPTYQHRPSRSEYHRDPAYQGRRSSGYGNSSYSIKKVRGEKASKYSIRLFFCRDHMIREEAVSFPREGLADDIYPSVYGFVRLDFRFFFHSFNKKTISRVL